MGIATHQKQNMVCKAQLERISPKTRLSLILLWCVATPSQTVEAGSLRWGQKQKRSEIVLKAPSTDLTNTMYTGGTS